MNPIFEFDPQKNGRNKEKHGLHLAEAQALWEVPHVIFPARHFSGEDRYYIVGKLYERMYVSIFAARGLAIRLISLHRADSRWIAKYERMIHEEEEY